MQISPRVIGSTIHELGDGAFGDADVPANPYESDPMVGRDAFDEPERNVQQLGGLRLRVERLECGGGPRPGGADSGVVRHEVDRERGTSRIGTRT